jgi:hypothetical protein
VFLKFENVQEHDDEKIGKYVRPDKLISGQEKYKVQGEDDGQIEIRLSGPLILPVKK